MRYVTKHLTVYSLRAALALLLLMQVACTDKVLDLISSSKGIIRGSILPMASQYNQSHGISAPGAALSTSAENKLACGSVTVNLYRLGTSGAKELPALASVAADLVAASIDPLQTPSPTPNLTPLCRGVFL